MRTSVSNHASRACAQRTVLGGSDARIARGVSILSQRSWALWLLVVTEGFDTRDLKEAKALLEQLS
jgi:hypothetical protein